MVRVAFETKIQLFSFSENFQTLTNELTVTRQYCHYGLSSLVNNKITEGKREENREGMGCGEATRFGRL